MFFFKKKLHSPVKVLHAHSAFTYKMFASEEMSAFHKETLNSPTKLLHPKNFCIPREILAKLLHSAVKVLHSLTKCLRSLVGGLCSSEKHCVCLPRHRNSYSFTQFCEQTQMFTTERFYWKDQKLWNKVFFSHLICSPSRFLGSGALYIYT